MTQLTSSDSQLVVKIDKLEKQSTGYAVARTEWVVAATETREVPLVIGADGHQSTVRRQLGIDYAAAGPPQEFAVFEGQTDLDLDHEMRIVFDGDDLAVLWPLPDGRCRRSFKLPPSESPPKHARQGSLARGDRGTTLPAIGRGELPAVGGPPGTVVHGPDDPHQLADYRATSSPAWPEASAASEYGWPAMPAT